MSQASDNTEASMKKQIRRIHSIFSHVGADLVFFLCSSKFKHCIRILLLKLLKSPFSEALAHLKALKYGLLKGCCRSASPPLYFVFEISNNIRIDLTRPVMGTIFLVVCLRFIWENNKKNCMLNA